MNSIESINTQEIIPKKDLDLNNRLQIALAKMYFSKKGFEENNIIDWIDKFGLKFGNFIKQKSAGNSDFWLELKNKEVWDNLLLEADRELHVEENSEKLAA